MAPAATVAGVWVVLVVVLDSVPNMMMSHAPNDENQVAKPITAEAPDVRAAKVRTFAFVVNPDAAGDMSAAAMALRA